MFLEVVAAIEDTRANWGNPSSLYRCGSEARRVVESSRSAVSNWLGSESSQVIFTSGATEANNLAIHSALLSAPKKRHIVTSEVEHSSVLACMEYWERYHDYEVTRLRVTSGGLLASDAVADAIRPDTALVALMWANNETGVIWPIDEYARHCREKGVAFHTDAVQAAGRMDILFRETGVSSLSLSGHKVGPSSFFSNSPVSGGDVWPDIQNLSYAL